MLANRAVNRAGSTLPHVPLFSLQTARSYGKRVLSRGHGAKGPGSKQNYPCHLNIQALFQHPTIYCLIYRHSLQKIKTFIISRKIIQA